MIVCLSIHCIYHYLYIAQQIKQYTHILQKSSSSGKFFKIQWLSSHHICFHPFPPHLLHSMGLQIAYLCPCLFSVLSWRNRSGIYHNTMISASVLLYFISNHKTEVKFVYLNQLTPVIDKSASKDAVKPRSTFLCIRICYILF